MYVDMCTCDHMCLLTWTIYGQTIFPFTLLITFVGFQNLNILKPSSRILLTLKLKILT